MVARGSGSNARPVLGIGGLLAVVVALTACTSSGDQQPVSPPDTDRSEPTEEPQPSTSPTADASLDVDADWAEIRTELFDAFAILGFVSQGGDHEIPGSLSHLFQRLDEPAVQVDAVANADSPPGDAAEVGTVVVAGKDGPIVAYGPRVGPWFECRGIGISITSLETDDRVGYAIETAMSIAAELNCAN